MNKLWVLYQKEMKDSMLVFGLLSVLIVGMEAYSIFFLGDVGGLIFSILPLGILVTVLPLIMFYVYHQEWRSGSRYMLMSLPVPRYYIGLSKYLAVFSVGLVMAIVGAATIFWNYSQLDNSTVWAELTALIPSQESELSAFYLWTGCILIFISILYLGLGMVVATQSVNLVVKRRPILVTIISLVFFVAFYVRSTDWLMELLSYALGESLLNIPLEFSFAFHMSMLSGDFTFPPGAIYLFLSWNAFTVLSGIVFLLGGLILTEKYLEV